MSRLKNKLNGEKALAVEIIKVLPLIKKYFKDFDGKKALIKSGLSGSILKVAKSFREEANELVNNDRLVIFMDYSVATLFIKFKITHTNLDGSTEYYSENVYIGDIDIDNWDKVGTNLFTFRDGYSSQVESSLTNILNISEENLENTNYEIQNLKERLQELENSVPYQFIDIMRRGY